MYGKQRVVDLKRTDELDDILANFPFYRRNKDRQVRVLSRYLVECLGLSQVDTAEKLGVSRETVKQIRKAWNRLGIEDRVLLLRFLREQYIKSATRLNDDSLLPD